MSSWEGLNEINYYSEDFDLIFENIDQLNRLADDYAKKLEQYPSYVDIYRKVYGNLTKQVKQDTEEVRKVVTALEKNDQKTTKENISLEFQKALLTLKKDLKKSSL